MNGISVIDDGFEVVCKALPLGFRRHLDSQAVTTLEEFSQRYTKLSQLRRNAAELLVLGRDLYRWIEGDSGQLTGLLQRTTRPLRFEVAVARRFPSRAEWTLLHSPWELLADDKGYIAGDVPLGFSPIRRIGRVEAPPKLDQHRLGLVFMAASPRGIQELDYEAEETAILEAVGATKLDLLVEESGNPEELGDRLSEYVNMQALHFSCHGHNAWHPPDQPASDPKPVLWLEDKEGNALPTDADVLIRELRANRPHLVFLSACLTAAVGLEPPNFKPDFSEARFGVRGGVAESLATTLIAGDIPAVIGWDGSVADRAAISFAAVLYDRLASKEDLADAVAEARRGLLNEADEDRRLDWHLARLWLGPQGGGPIVGGTRRRAMMPVTQGEKEFLVKNQRKVPVASHEMFVGRRRELQTALRVLREGDSAGVLLHGMGRLGKSSLASRIANRRRDLRLAVVFEHYGALDILAALSEALHNNADARELLREGTELVRQDISHLEDVLTDLISGPCAQAGDGASVLLVIDDLEQILNADPAGGRHRIVPAYAPVIQTILRAFDPTHTDSRLLITSRFPFVMDGLEECLFELQLPPLSSAGQRKLARRQVESAVEKGLTGEALSERSKLLGHVPMLARGNPGLQDLIGRKIVLSAAVQPERAAQVLEEMQTWLGRGALPSDAEVRAFLENLAIDALVDMAGSAARSVLRALMLFDLPIPASIAEELAVQAGTSIQHGRNLGLIDLLDDVVDPGIQAVALNSLAAGRLEPLNEEEMRVVANKIAHDLFVAWGGLDAAKRPAACDLELARLGLMAEDGEIVATCATDAVRFLLDRSLATAGPFGQELIRLLDKQGRTVPWRLLSETANSLATLGDGSSADGLLDRGAAALLKQRSVDGVIDPVAAGFLAYGRASRLVQLGRMTEAQTLFEEAVRLAEAAGDEISASIAFERIAEILTSRGKFEEALLIHREALSVYDRLGDARSHAIAQGRVATILFNQGHLDEALRIRQEEQLPVYDRLNDQRERATALGKIANILSAKGDDKGARVLHEERLKISRLMQHADGTANALWSIAQHDLDEGNLKAAVPKLVEAYDILIRLGRAEGIAAIGLTYGDILKAVGETDKARTVLARSANIFRKLGRTADAEVAEERISQLGSHQ